VYHLERAGCNVKLLRIKILCFALFFLIGLNLIGSIINVGVFLSGNGDRLTEKSKNLTEETEGFISEYFKSCSNLNFQMVIFSLIVNILYFLSILALWKMKKKSVYLFLTTFVLSLFIPFILNPKLMEVYNGKIWVAFILPSIYLIVVLPCWKYLTPANVMKRDGL